MSVREPRPRELISLDERIERAHARRLELQPALGGLVKQGKAAFELLRPRATFIAGSAPGAPLLWQRVHGAGPGIFTRPDAPDAVGGVIEEYVIARLPSGVNLILHKDLGTATERSYVWKFVRHEPTSDRRSEETRVLELDRFCLGYEGMDGSNVFDTEVSASECPEGGNLRQYMHAGFVCNSSNGYREAETYITAMKSDIAEAVELFWTD